MIFTYKDRNRRNVGVPKNCKAYLTWLSGNAKLREVRKGGQIEVREHIVKLVDEESRDFLAGKTKPLDYFARVEAIFTVVREQMREERLRLAIHEVAEKYLPPEVK